MLKQPFFNGREFNTMYGLNTYDYGARQYDGARILWDRLDPLCEKYYHINPYVYCAGNPVRFIDKDGKEPGDAFLSKLEAALDFMRNYYHISVKDNKEYGSIIYCFKEGEETYYSYNKPNIGGEDYVDVNNEIPKDATCVADIHSHGGFSNDYDGENFSKADKEPVDNFNKTDNNTHHIESCFLVTPSGKLKEYTYKSNKQPIIVTFKLNSNNK